MNTRETALHNAARWFDEGHFQAELERRVACATASDAGGPLAPLADYLTETIAPGLTRLGFECTVLPNPEPSAGPLLVARRVESADLPTVLTYGHGDVVNGQERLWREGLNPWALTIEGDRWYGRGTADNKGQHTVNLGALEQVIAARNGRLGYNVTVLLETGEEVGSPGLRELCQQERERLRADLLIACDGPRVHAQRPTVFLGSRGVVNFRLRLRARERAYHSGNWGGVLANPGIRVSHAVASMVDATGRIQVPGLLPPPIEPSVRAALHDVDIGGDVDDPVTTPGWGEPGLTEAERLMAWNTLEVLALGAGAPERPVNAIPHTAVAHCQLRHDLGFETLAAAGPHIKAGKLTALAVNSAQRSSLLPDLPGMAELGMASAGIEAIYGMAVPASTPASVVQRLSAEVAGIKAQPEVKDKLAALQLEPTPLGAAHMASTLASETAKYRAVAARAKINMNQ